MENIKRVVILSGIPVVVGAALFSYSVLQGFVNDAFVDEGLAIGGAVCFFVGLIIFIVGMLLTNV